MTLNIRLFIAFSAYFAQENKTYGVITQLAKDYAISRTFIYILLFSFHQNLLPTFSPVPKILKVSQKKEAIKEILLQRMVGKSSIKAISMNNLNYKKIQIIGEKSSVRGLKANYD